MRNGDIIDEYVAEVCIARLARKDAADLLAPRSDWMDVATLNSTREALKRRRQSIASFVARGLMTDTDADESLVSIAHELQSIGDQIALAVLEDPLAEVAAVEDVRDWWMGASLARRRLVVEALMAVKIHPVGNGKRVTTLSGAAATISVEWITR
ncbi:hypothetical protein SAMN04487788_2870 [Microbacterium testaceum StLB037]|uniref:Uncharacterized protein n=2 Tax=Microbacterium testaceum TaxID=2033 RepID=A0A1H0RJZ7_MICTS|nr:hypothetical protein SAMN04487788_2870 [Microbacterium testaceum StLB037]